MTISRKSKEAFKTALAMTIAYGISLRMGWDKPMWAGFAVAFVSLATVGQSLNKAAMRMLGTLVAIIAGLTIIALFDQERWLFILFLSAWVGFCTYMMGGTKYQYFWNVCGFVCVIVCLDAGPSPVNAFDIAMARAEQTGMGILVYSLVSIFLWPAGTQADFEDAAVNLVSILHKIYQSCFVVMKGGDGTGDTKALRSQGIQAQARFDKLLDAAKSDSYKTWELRWHWRRCQDRTAELAEIMEQWDESFAELQALDLQRFLQNLKTFGLELDLRFAQIERMLTHQAPERYPEAVNLSLNKTELQTLTHFQKAALAVARNRLQRLDTLTRSLFESVSVIKGFSQADTVADPAPTPHTGFVIDPDRAASVVQVMVTMWLAYLALIYVNDIPGGSGFVTMASVFGMALATRPQLPVSLLFLPAAVSVLFAGLVYIFVMPKLSSFLGLGPMIFILTFAICYLFASPRQILGRVFGLAMFSTITSISNEQSYSFFVVANTAMMFSLAFFLLTITAHVPFSPCPERAFLRLVSRFFRSCEYLMPAMRWDPQRKLTFFDRWKKAFHVREVMTLPRKLGVWAPHIDTKSLPGTSPEQVQLLTTKIQALAFSIQELLRERGTPQAPFLVQALLTDFRTFRLLVQKTFQWLAVDPAADDRAAFGAGLAEIAGHLETSIKETMDLAAESQISAQESENFYRLLGAYRGVSKALHEYARSAGAIDWAIWREEKF